MTEIEVQSLYERLKEARRMGYDPSEEDMITLEVLCLEWLAFRKALEPDGKDKDSTDKGGKASDVVLSDPDIDDFHDAVT